MLDPRRLTRAARTLLSATLTAASVGFLGLLAVALATGFYVPLLSDEVATHLGNARVVQEHGTTVSLLPQCEASWVQRVPISLYPGALLKSLAYENVGLLGLKISGIMGAIAGFAGAAWLACRRIVGTRERLHAVAGLCAISSFGVVPFIVILSRSEQPMKLCLVAYCLLPIASRRARSWAARIAAGAAFLAVSSLFFFNHTKSLFYLPFVLVAGFVTAPRRGRAAWCGVVFASVLVMAFQSLRLASELVRCDEAPELTRWFGTVSLVPRDAFVAPGRFFATGLENLVGMPAHAWKEVLFSANNTGWVPLPRLWRLSPGVSDLNETTGSAFVALVWGTPLMLVVAYRRRSPATRWSLALGLGLVIGISANAFFYKTYPFYNCGLLVPALSLVAALAIAGRRAPLVPRALGQLGVLALVALGAANLATLVREFGPKLREGASHVGPTVADQPAAVPIFGYAAERPKIRALAKSCGIDGDDATHLVIDDYTLHAFERLHQPLNLIYVTDAIPWIGITLAGPKLPALLHRLASPGIIGRCHWFPVTLRPKAHVAEDYCCLGSDEF